MSKIALIGASCNAFGHPTECEEPATGIIVSDSSSSVTINGTAVATIATASISFSSHSHDYSSQDGCYNKSSHSIDPDTTTSSITLNQSPLYLAGVGVATDPISGGNVSIDKQSSADSVIIL
jgi:hypothetical protein